MSNNENDSSLVTNCLAFEIIAELLQKIIVDDLNGQNSDSQTMTKKLWPSSCTKILDALGFGACLRNDAMENFTIAEKLCYRSSGKTHQLDENLLTLDNENSDDDIIIFDRYPNRFSVINVQRGCQTDPIQLTTKKKKKITFTRADLPLAPCELKEQTIYIDALTAPMPQIMYRLPLGDRLCYTLAEFASAIYLGVLVMCCCNPGVY